MYDLVNKKQPDLSLFMDTCNCLKLQPKYLRLIDLPRYFGILVTRGKDRGSGMGYRMQKTYEFRPYDQNGSNHAGPDESREGRGTNESIDHGNYSTTEHISCK